MAFEKRDNSGAVFKNSRPNSDKSPPLTGNAMINGVEYWISAWTKTDKNGEKWMSLAFKEKNPSVANSQKAQATDTSSYDEDSIPF